MTKPAVTITYGHDFCDDCNKLTGLTYGAWTETDTGNLLSSVTNLDDYFNLTRAAGTAEAYLSYPNEAGEDNLGLSSTGYTVIYYRYNTSNLNIKAKILLVFNGWDIAKSEAENLALGKGQIVLAETSSTTIKTGFTYITSGKTIDHIRLYANAAPGAVGYDFVLICKGIFTFPNTQYGSEFTPPPRYALIPIPSRVADVTHNLGSESASWTASCNLDIGSWKRTGDYVKAEVFIDIAHNSYKEPFQWLDTGLEQFKVTLETPRFPRHSDSHTLDLTFREYSRSSKSNESYVERFGLNR